MGTSSTISPGDTAFVLVAAALVMVMTPGLAFFYGGLVRRKNVLAIMMQSFISMGVVTVIWVLVGYSLAFSGNVGGVIGNLSWVGLRHVGIAPGPWAKTIPALAHFSFQEMFAIITPALITGAFADRVRFKSYLKFLVAWSLLVYVPIVHWIWGGGPGQMGGARLRRGDGRPRQRRLRRAGLGVGRGGQEVRPGREGGAQQRGVRRPRDGVVVVRLVRVQCRVGTRCQRVAAQAFVNTDIAGSVAMCTWLLIGWWRSGKPSTIGAFTGAVAGLACVTPCAGYVPTWARS